MKRILLACFGWVLMLPCFVGPLPAAAPLTGRGMTNEFFAMDTGVHGATLKTPEAKARLLKELGFTGLGWTPPGVAEMMAALDHEGLKMATLYVGVRIGEGELKYDPQLPQYITALKGRGTILWLHISSKSDQPSAPAGDERAVVILREIAALAQAAGLRVALYPHAGTWLERVADAVRVVQKVERGNVGVTFNLCHVLRVGDGPKIPELLKAVAPHLFVVTLNGADHEGDWSRLIQPLDGGEFEVAPLLGQLKAINFQGPIGLQHYGVKGDARENLRRSLATWRGLVAP